MPAPRCRPFTVLDGMILVGATAVGLWIGRTMGMVGSGLFGIKTVGFFGSWPSVEWPDSSHPLFRWGTYRGIHRALAGVAFEAIPVMFPWTLALVLVRLRRPRPPLCRLARQPGFAACVAVSVVGLVSFLGQLSSAIERTTWGDGFPFHLRTMLIGFRDLFLTVDWGPQFGVAVLAVWGVMALGRMFRRERGWIDLTGRVLGAYWVATLVLAVSGIQAD